MSSLFFASGLDRALMLFALSLARIVPAIVFLPIFSDKVLGRTLLRPAMIAMVIFGLYPVIAATPVDPTTVSLIPLLLSEAVMGLFIGLTLGAPWIAMQVCGELIDNQRGATMANAIDPASGIEASPIASWLSFMWTTLLLAGGGMQTLLSILATSYRRVPLGKEMRLDLATLSVVGKLLTDALMTGILLALPAVIAMLLAETLLGMLSKFAPQLNAFSIALTVKSLVAIALLLFYLGPDAFGPTRALMNTRMVSTMTPAGTHP